MSADTKRIRSKACEAIDPTRRETPIVQAGIVASWQIANVNGAMTEINTGEASICSAVFCPNSLRLCLELEQRLRADDCALVRERSGSDWIDRSLALSAQLDVTDRRGRQPIGRGKSVEAAGFPEAVERDLLTEVDGKSRLSTRSTSRQL